MGLQIQLLDLVRIQRFRAMLSKSRQKKAERKKLDRLLQDSITERQRYDQARRKRTEIMQPHNTDIEVATARHSHPHPLFALKPHE
jgi:hypothetical protein